MRKGPGSRELCNCSVRVTGVPLPAFVAGPQASLLRLIASAGARCLN